MRVNSQVMFVRAALFIAVGLLVGCDMADTSTVTANDGRKRLNVNLSYAEFGGYVVHVNAMNSARLTPEIASTYGITRSENTGLINLVVLEKSADPGSDLPVSADVQLVAANLTGQTKNIELQEIKDDVSIYYIGSVAVENRETINFDFDISPAGSDRVLKVRFNHEFYTR